jgi:hypothetical protein
VKNTPEPYDKCGHSDSLLTVYNQFRQIYIFREKFRLLKKIILLSLLQSTGRMLLSHLRLASEYSNASIFSVLFQYRAQLTLETGWGALPAGMSVIAPHPDSEGK